MSVFAGVAFALSVVVMVIVAILGRRYLQAMRDEMDQARSYVDGVFFDLEELMALQAHEETAQIPTPYPRMNGHRPPAEHSSGRHHLEP